MNDNCAEVTAESLMAEAEKLILEIDERFKAFQSHMLAGCAAFGERLSQAPIADEFKVAIRDKLVLCLDEISKEAP